MHRRSAESEVGNGCQFVPLDRLFAEVKVFESERDAAQKVVFTQRLGTEHAQLQLPQAERFLAVATVHQLGRGERETAVRCLKVLNTFAAIHQLRHISTTKSRKQTISLKVGFLVFLEILVFRLEVLCGSGSR